MPPPPTHPPEPFNGRGGALERKPFVTDGPPQPTDELPRIFAIPAWGCLAIPSRGGFAIHARGFFAIPSRGCFAIPARGCFASPSRGDFASPSKGGFAIPTRGCYPIYEVLLFGPSFVLAERGFSTEETTQYVP